MKKILCLIFILFCLVIPAASGDIIIAKFAAGPGSIKTPP
jgi:hypothetical protein